MRKTTPKTTATAAELRADIDRGLTGDKVSIEDPAAAPLGTDDEAAGIPVSPELMARTREAALEIGDQVRRAASGGQEPTGLGGAIPWLLIAAFVISLLAIVWIAIAVLR